MHARKLIYAILIILVTRCDGLSPLLRASSRSLLFFLAAQDQLRLESLGAGLYDLVKFTSQAQDPWTAKEEWSKSSATNPSRGTAWVCPDREDPLWSNGRSCHVARIRMSDNDAGGYF